MKNIQCSILLMFLIILSSCSDDQVFIEKNKQAVITSKIAIYDPNNEIKVWTPEKKDTDKALAGIYKYLKNAQKNKEILDYKKSQIKEVLKDKSKYCVQFIGITRNNKKVIFCNFFPSDNKNYLKRWKEQRILVLDGGHWYWNIEYNLEDNKCSNLFINGKA